MKKTLLSHRKYIRGFPTEETVLDNVRQPDIVRRTSVIKVNDLLGAVGELPRGDHVDTADVMNSDATTTVQTLRDRAAAFVTARNWHQFHSPKNLVMSLSAEAAELLEHFLWMENAESHDVCKDETKLNEVCEELSDVLCNLLCLCNALKVDLSAAFARKMAKNELKYPADRYRGRYQ